MLLEIEARALPGDHIEDACNDAKRIARILDCVIIIPFNDVKVLVYPDSDIKAISHNYSLAIYIEDPNLKGIITDTFPKPMYIHWKELEEKHKKGQEKYNVNTRDP